MYPIAGSIPAPASPPYTEEFTLKSLPVVLKSEQESERFQPFPSVSEGVLLLPTIHSIAIYYRLNLYRSHFAFIGEQLQPNARRW